MKKLIVIRLCECGEPIAYEIEENKLPLGKLLIHDENCVKHSPDNHAMGENHSIRLESERLTRHNL